MGGPLVYNGVVIGIMSTIEPTFCNQGVPVGFTKVTDYLDWLANEGGIPVDP
jgi:secreted trypsin-like serine protease